MAQAFGVMDSLQIIKATGSVELRTSTRGRKSKVEEHHSRKILEMLSAESDLTLDEIRNRLHLNCSLTTIHRAVKKLGFSRMMIYACEQKRPEVIKQREEWIQFIKSVNPEKLGFLDESAVNTDFTRNYGRSIGKSRVVDHAKYSKKHYGYFFDPT